MKTEHDPGKIALWKSLRHVLLLCLLLGLLNFGWTIYRGVLIQQGLLDILLAATPGTSKSHVQQALGRGQEWGSDTAGGTDLIVPLGGQAVRYDSFMITWMGHPVDFWIVYDRNERVTGLEFVSSPIDWPSVRRFNGRRFNGSRQGFRTHRMRQWQQAEMMLH
jgi:hypothetical protein